MAMYVSELNTGKLTFDGVKIKGALGGSSDSLGSDTIELVPDTAAYADDQYLIIEPTANNHIHIRAGGTQDDSDASLILGGEKSNITINDQFSYHVSIFSRKENDLSSHVWKFNNDGSTGFPSILVDLQTGESTVEAIKFGNEALKSVITGPTPKSGVNALPLILQGQNHTGAEAADINIWAGASDRNAGNINIIAGTSTGAAYDPGTVRLQAGSNLAGVAGNVSILGGIGSSTVNDGKVTVISGSNNWEFNNNGSTSFPTITTSLLGTAIAVEALKFGDNTKLSVITGPTPIASTAVNPIIVQGQDQTGAAGGDVHLYGGKSNQDAGNIEIIAGRSTGAAYDAGVITLQAGSNIAGTGGNVSILGGTGSGSTTHGKVKINTSIVHEWTFENNGNLTIPNLKDIQDVDGNTAISGGNRVKSYISSSGPVVPIDENNIYAINTTAQATTVKLPSSGSVPIGYEFTVTDTIGNAANKNITITADSGDSIISAPSGIAIDTNFGLLAFKFIGGKDWIILYGR